MTLNMLQNWPLVKKKLCIEPSSGKLRACGKKPGMRVDFASGQLIRHWISRIIRRAQKCTRRTVTAVSLSFREAFYFTSLSTRVPAGWFRRANKPRTKHLTRSKKTPRSGAHPAPRPGEGRYQLSISALAWKRNKGTERESDRDAKINRGRGLQKKRTSFRLAMRGGRWRLIRTPLDSQNFGTPPPTPMRSPRNRR